jgi:hypothetical protein
MKKYLISVLTIDIVDSKKYSPKKQPVVKKEIREAFSKINKEYKEILLLPITPTIGDEYQGVVSPHWKILNLVDRFRTLLRLQGKNKIDLHISIGMARGSITKEKEARLQEGPAFYLSRDGIDWLKDNRTRRTKILTEDDPVNKLIDLILTYQDMILLNWTEAQWQAVSWRDQGLNLKEIGSKLDVAYQNIGKRLKAANFENYIRGREFLENYLKETPLTG